MSYIDYQPADYGDWILEQNRSDIRPYDVALICRLLNNLSDIDIESSVDSHVLSELTSVRRQPAPTAFHPANCLAGPVPDCRSLVTSNARVHLNGGISFRQASLSDYLRGLHQLSGAQ